jgi:hypothetical protein
VRALAGVIAQADAVFVEPEELLVVAARLGERLEDLEGALARFGPLEELEQRAARPAVRGVALERVAERRERPLGVAQHAQPQVAELREELGLRRRIRGDLGLARQDLGQLGVRGVRVLRAQHALERRERRRLVARQAQRLAQVVGRLGQVAELLLEELREPQRQRALELGVEGGVDALGVDAREAREVARRRGQPLERLARRGRRSRFGERARPGLEGRARVAALDFLDARDLGERRQAISARVLDAEAQLVELDDAGPVVRRAQHGLEGRHG